MLYFVKKTEQRRPPFCGGIGKKQIKYKTLVCLRQTLHCNQTFYFIGIDMIPPVFNMQCRRHMGTIDRFPLDMTHLMYVSCVFPH